MRTNSPQRRYVWKNIIARGRRKFPYRPDDNYMPRLRCNGKRRKRDVDIVVFNLRLRGRSSQTYPAVPEWTHRIDCE